MPPKDRFVIHSRAVVCSDVDLKGEVTIGSNTVVHPKVTIYAVAGPITIGSGCIIEEGVVIVNRRKDVMRIGEENHFEINSRVECAVMGNCNVIGTRARLHLNASLSSYCVVQPAVEFSPTTPEMLPDYTVLYGEGASERRLWSGQGAEQERALRQKHAEYLRELLPKFNRQRKGDVD
ncbi:trimeric LpxA-like protein [Calocera cornea HHB12733]|uniref:Dynactin subunit 6 n=1 Tax=Calocera cornea HHB12733 TaxID=1353952 RepID=A0A165JZB9_9BASI|nr:trimeric LpxA-like protein [Calocera cornea HHB12733]